MSLFEPGWKSLQQYLLYPGGIFRFVGTFLTQFLYYPVLGTIILILIWLLCVWLTKISFSFSHKSYPLCFIIPFCLLISVLHFDEASLTFESQGYVFYNTLGFTSSIASFFFYKIFKKFLAKSFIVIILPVLYPIAGFFSLLPAVMGCLDLCLEFKDDRKKFLQSAVSAVVSAILLIIVPLLYYRYCNGTTADSYLLYLRGLPELTTEGYDWYLWCPFAIASLILLIFTLFSSLTNNSRINSSKIVRWTSSLLFLLGMILSLSADNKKSEQFHATILMVNAINKHDWNRVLNIMSLTKESPNYTMLVLDNLARSYTHNNLRDLGNMVVQYKDPRHDEEYSITAFVNVPVNHFIGRFNQSHHWATEHIVQYGNKVFFIKYIVLNAIMNGDMKFAKKFNSLLLNTMFHRSWAEEMNKYIENPSLIETMPDFGYLMRLRHEEMLRGE